MNYYETKWKCFKYFVSFDFETETNSIKTWTSDDDAKHYLSVCVNVNIKMKIGDLFTTQTHTQWLIWLKDAFHNDENEWIQCQVIIEQKIGQIMAGDSISWSLFGHIMEIRLLEA